MAIIIIGCGRSGTSMAVEILASSGQLLPSLKIDTKDLFKIKIKKWPKRFLTKGPTPPYFEYKELRNFMLRDKNAKIIWTIRNPRDILMSKMRRGMPFLQGGDCKKYAADSTSEGAVNNIFRMMNSYKKVVRDFPKRVFLLRMEEVLSSFEPTIKSLCNFVGIEYNDEMKDFYKRMRNLKKKKRYDKIEKKEIQKSSKWEESYGGFFFKEGIDLSYIFEKLKPVTEYFRY